MIMLLLRLSYLVGRILDVGSVVVAVCVRNTLCWRPPRNEILTGLLLLLMREAQVVAVAALAEDMMETKLVYQGSIPQWRNTYVASSM